MKPIRIHIEGMSCGGCVSRVESALQTVEGVKRASVNLTTEMALVEPGTQPAVTGGTLLEAIRLAGYDGYVLHPGKQQTPEDRAHEEKLREQRQAFVHALSTGFPIIGLHYLGPFLTTGGNASLVWPATLQGILCVVLLLSPAGAPILVGGLRAMWFRTPNMDLLVSLGLTAAFLGSVWGLLSAAVDLCHFHAVAMIVLFIALGRYIELAARRRAFVENEKAAGQLPHTVTRIAEKGTEQVKLVDVQVGDRLAVSAGSTIPVDGNVTKGQALVEKSVMTGEPFAYPAREGDAVISGARVTDGLLEITATAVGRDSLMGRIAAAIENSQQGKTNWQRIADRFAGILVPIVVSCALLALVINLLMGSSSSEALSRMIAVLVIACPCAMGLATPTAIMIASSVAARSGIFFRQASAWEVAAEIQCILFDKTGTLTLGVPEVGDVKVVHPIAGFDTPADVINLAAVVEQFVDHPMAHAVVRQRDHEVPVVGLDMISDFESVPGAGCAATWDGHRIVVGSRAYLESNGITVNGEFNSAAAEHHANQHQADGVQAEITRTFVGLDGSLLGVIEFRESVRADAHDAIQQLRAMGVASVMVTGDARDAAAKVAEQAGIDHVEAQKDPMQKVQTVKAFRERYGSLGFVGDGVNDGPALAEADLGIVMANATELASSSASVSILGTRLQTLVVLISQARAAVRVIRQNLLWAFGYNLTALPAAAMGWVPPGLAAALMMVSSISVVMNSLRLARQRNDEAAA
ncbi:MAG: heavy metal translocating P-type ATPase [Phycisphaerae bacterium]